MKPSVYIETTIPSYLTAWPSRDIVRAAHQQLTRDWWDKRRGDFHLYVSAERLEALEGIAILNTPEASENLARRLMVEAGLPERAATDALHIALAAWHGMDFLLTWNCAHINNPYLIRRVERACQAEGFACPVICSPDELMSI